MDNPKYQKIICVNEDAWIGPVLCDAISRLVYCMLETNKLNKETAARFCIETVPVEQMGGIGIRIQWGRRVNEEVLNDQERLLPEVS